MGKKTSKPKIDSAYYFIGAIVVAILGYYYYINYYQKWY
ncbi:putative membrane protein [Emiliania huxleyi virus 145]|nr:putative membrane protein [Emiliania huxleyi virus 145]